MGMMTLNEYAKSLDPSDKGRAPIEMFAASADFYDAFPIDGMTGPVWEGYRQAAKPTITFRGANEGSSSGAGKLTPFQEATFRMDHDIDVDTYIVDRMGTKRLSYEETMGIAAAGQKWATTFITGDNTSDPREFNGLQARSALFSRAQHNSSSSGGAALSLLKLDQAINAVNKPTHIIAPYDSRPLWAQAARTSSLTGFVMKEFTLADGSGKGVGAIPAEYNGLKFLWGFPKDDCTPPLRFNEVGNGGGAAVTASLYVCSFGEGRLHGIQLKPLTVTPPKLLENEITWRTHLSWDIGLVDEHKYCFCRLDSITNAAIVA